MKYQPSCLAWREPLATLSRFPAANTAKPLALRAGEAHPKALLLLADSPQALAWCMFLSMSGICALCKTNADLQDSHIIPEFLYGPLYDHIHRFRIVPLEAGAREELLQKGLREPLLCSDCEQRLSRWEDYAKTAFVDSRGVHVTQHQDAVAFANLDYRTFKLFQLSLLWRMSVTQLDFFKEVVLGPHQERIRLALLSNDPLSPDEYPCHRVAVEINRKPYFDWITPPCLERLDGFHIYWLVINGIMHSFYVGSHAPPPDLSPSFLNAGGAMVVSVRQLAEIPCLLSAVRSLAAAHKARNRKD
jgi:hypothetical protein